jgi:hypothetical protein
MKTPGSSYAVAPFDEEGQRKERLAAARGAGD